MKRIISSTEKQYIAQLLKKRRERELDKEISKVFYSKERDIERLTQYEEDNKLSTRGITYGEIEQNKYDRR